MEVLPNTLLTKFSHSIFSEVVIFTFDDYVELTICWKDKEETFKLSLYK